MAICFSIILFSSAIVLISRQNGANAQQLKTVIAGESVEFSCTLSESLPPGDISWQIQWDGSPFTINAETTAEVSGPEFTSNHGNFRTAYRADRGFRYTHHCTLIIEGIQLGDAGHYSCKHVGNFRDRGIFSEHELRVLPRPPDNQLPQCLTSVITHTSNSPQGDTIELSCHFTGGNPPARLVWYKQGLQIGQIKENSNVLEYQLQASDNGLEFSCHAMSPALSETSYCNITPMEIQPNATLIPSDVKVMTGADVTFTCFGQGLPSINHFAWYLNGVQQEGQSARGIIRTDLSASSSDLTLENLQDTDNGMDVICEVSVISGLTADALVRITISSNIPTEVRVTDFVTNTPTQVRVTDRVTNTLTPSIPFVISKKITPDVNFIRSTSNVQSTYIPKRNAKVTTRGYNRVEIGSGAKLDNSKQKPSPSKKQSNVPITATAIGIICLLILAIIIVIVVKRRQRRSHKHMQPLPPSPTDSIPSARDPSTNEYANRMYEGTIYNSSQRQATDNFYQTAPFEEDPEKTWSAHEGCGIWQDSKVHTYENTAIGRPFPTFARQQNEESEHFLYDVVERQVDNTI